MTKVLKFKIDSGLPFVLMSNVLRKGNLCHKYSGNHYEVDETDRHTKYIDKT